MKPLRELVSVPDAWLENLLDHVYGTHDGRQITQPCVICTNHGVAQCAVSALLIDTALRTTGLGAPGLPETERRR